MTVLYPDPCYNEVCYKGTALEIVMSSSCRINIGPDKDSLCTKNCIYFLTHQLKPVFWVLKRTVSLRRFL